MTLPNRNAKDYLEIKGTESEFTVMAEKRHADELQSLFSSRGLICRRDARHGEDTLRFDRGVNRAAIEMILESYKQSKGS
jgi:hypothetical protein